MDIVITVTAAPCNLLWVAELQRIESQEAFHVHTTEVYRPRCTGNWQRTADTSSTSSTDY